MQSTGPMKGLQHRPIGVCVGGNFTLLLYELFFLLFCCFCVPLFVFRWGWMKATFFFLEFQGFKATCQTQNQGEEKMRCRKPFEDQKSG